MKYETIYQFLRTYADIPEQQWTILESLVQENSYKKGDILLRAGEDAQHFHLILDGFMRMYYLDSKGNEYTKTFRDKFDIASPYAEMLQGIASRIYIEALEDSKTISLKYSDFKNLFKQHGCWSTLARKFTEKYYMLKEHREYEFLLLSAKERYDNFCTEYQHIMHKIPQYQIASYLGITPVSLSRLLKK